MKMMKSFLLGSAAGLAAAAGAQAADLPVKAKPVEYVKVCSTYGAGFFYIPGTDTCIKIGGFVRTEWNHNAGGSLGQNIHGADGYYTRASDSVLANRTRALVSFDVRSQTEYGTLRSFIRSGWQWDSNTDTIGGSASRVYLDRAFIQFAGFTFGKTQSFFDVPDISDMTYSDEIGRNNTGGTGTPVFAYTAMLGNGVTATVSIEDYTERRANIVGITGASFTAGTDNAAKNHGNETPDIVANLRVDQAWGSAQVSGALHLNQATYYATQPAGTVTAHPDDKWGWAVGAGLLLKMPWNPKDTFAVAGAYGVGATNYPSKSPGSFGARSVAASLFQDGGVAVGWLDDAYFNDGATAALRGELELPKVWSAQAGFQHYWTNSLRSSIWGVYSKYEANSATVDTVICAGRGFGPGCADFNLWAIGSRTIWNPVTNLDIGLEVVYTAVDTAFNGGRAGCVGAGCIPSGAPAAGIPAVHNIQDNGVWSGALRIQRSFWP